MKDISEAMARHGKARTRRLVQTFPAFNLAAGVWQFLEEAYENLTNILDFYWLWVVKTYYYSFVLDFVLCETF